jgi:hypothetical protein
MISSDVPALLARATEAARTEFERKLSEATAWAEWVRAGAPHANACIVCGQGGTEAHHIAGRHNSPTTVPVCPPCHRRLSERQNGWDPRWVRPDNPPDQKEALLLRGLSDLCEERGRFDPAYHLLGKRLRAAYAKKARGESL